MKNSLKKINLVGLLLGIFLMVCFINITNGVVTINKNPGEKEHIVLLHSLYLWGNGGSTDTVGMKINTGEDIVELVGGLAIGSSHNVSNADSSVIAGGQSNTMETVKNSGIAGGQNNRMINSNASLIAGGQGNLIRGDNAVIGGGSGNNVYANNGVIIGGKSNKVWGENGIILGGENNEAKGGNSLVMGNRSRGHTGSFIWNSQSGTRVAGENSAYIGVDSGVLVGTTGSVNGVSLVVNGPMKLESITRSETTGGDIRFDNGCLYAYDGDNWQIMGRASRLGGNCAEIDEMCQFGAAYLSQGDVQKAYTNYWSSNVCESIDVMCSGGELVDISSHQTGVFYPYCYTFGVYGSEREECDLNNDGKVSLSEITLVVNCIIENEDCPSEYDYDVNGDGRVNILDVIICSNKKAERCDLNESGNFDISDRVRFNNYCTNGIIGGTLTPEQTQKCDFNEDGKLDISDQVAFIRECNI